MYEDFPRMLHAKMPGLNFEGSSQTSLDVVIWEDL